MPVYEESTEKPTKISSLDNGVMISIKATSYYTEIKFTDPTVPGGGEEVIPPGDFGGDFGPDFGGGG